MAVGDGTDPNHSPPYLVVTHVSSQEVEGPFSDPDADEALRVQITGVGVSRKQSDWARDKARIQLTKRNLTSRLATDSTSRVAMQVELDLSMGVRYDRGVSDPVFVGLDQYVVKTTPA